MSQPEAIAAVCLNTPARMTLQALNVHKSILWEDLAEVVGLPWPIVCKAVGLLCVALFAEAGSSRLRITVQGDWWYLGAEESGMFANATA